MSFTIKDIIIVTTFVGMLILISLITPSNNTPPGNNIEVSIEEYDNLLKIEKLHPPLIPLIKEYYKDGKITVYEYECINQIYNNVRLKEFKNKHQIPNTKYQIPNTKYQIPNTKYQINNKKIIIQISVY